jgi:hypothetical protein
MKGIWTEPLLLQPIRGGIAARPTHSPDGWPILTQEPDSPFVTRPVSTDQLVGALRSSTDLPLHVTSNAGAVLASPAKKLRPASASISPV